MSLTRHKLLVPPKILQHCIPEDVPLSPLSFRRGGCAILRITQGRLVIDPPANVRIRRCPGGMSRYPGTSMCAVHAVLAAIDRKQGRQFSNTVPELRSSAVRCFFSFRMTAVGLIEELMIYVGQSKRIRLQSFTMP